ncbi:MAG: four helix bundle protein [Candidatus Paceibacterota bacterium]|jgi:four helix bundle protein
MKDHYFRFFDWPLYQDSKKFSTLSIQLVKKLPKEFRFDVGSQIIRSSISVVLNIAEGSGKNSDKDFNHFLNISSGSLFETIAAFDILKDNKLIKETEFMEILSLGNKITSQLGGLKKSLSGQK